MKKLLATVVFAALAAACSSGPPPPPPPPPWTPAGSYDVSIDAMGMQLGGLMTITDDAGMYGGTLSTEVGDVELTDFVVDLESKEVTFLGSSPDFSLAFEIAMTEADFSGQFEIAGMGSGSISGTKRAGSLP